MTRAEIAAELRRSACEDFIRHLAECDAFDCALSYCCEGEFYRLFKGEDDWRLFYLIVAEAIND